MHGFYSDISKNLMFQIYNPPPKINTQQKSGDRVYRQLFLKKVVTGLLQPCSVGWLHFVSISPLCDLKIIIFVQIIVI